MTVKERLHELVDRMSQDEAVDLLRLAENLHDENVHRPKLPDFVGMGDSGRSDVSENVEDILRAGFGR